MVEWQGWQRFPSSYAFIAHRVSTNALPHDGPSPTIPCSWRDTEHSESFILMTANRKNLREHELQVAAGTPSLPQLNSYRQIPKPTILFRAVACLGRKVQEMWNEKVAAGFPSAQTLQGLYCRRGERSSVGDSLRWSLAGLQPAGCGRRQPRSLQPLQRRQAPFPHLSVCLKRRKSIFKNSPIVWYSWTSENLQGKKPPAKRC